MKAFIDTNVLVDVLAKREPFYQHSVVVWTLAEQSKIRGLISALSFANIYYVVSRFQTRAVALRTLTQLRDTFTAVPLDAQILNQAIDAGFKDFEDAVQYFSALRADAACIISRNPDHFPSSDLPVLSPKEFLTAHSFE